MLKVITHSISPEDRKQIRKILSLVGIEENRYRLLDISIEDQDVQTNRDQVLSVGKHATRKCVRDLVSSSVLTNTTFLGNDLIDKDNLFFLYHIPDVITFMSSDVNKQYVWEKLQEMKGLLDEWVPFDDEISFGSEKTESPQEVAQEDEPSTDKEIVYKEPVVPVREIDDTLRINIDNVLLTMFEKVDFNDQNLGKTLGKFEAFSIECENTTINIYPAGRVPSSDENGISLKDLLIVLRSAKIFGSEYVTLIKNGTR